MQERNSDQDTPNATDFTSRDTIVKADAIADGDETKEAKDGCMVEKKKRKGNLFRITMMLTVLMLGERVFRETQQQWLYLRFEKEVMGANFSHLNVSAVRHPCLTKHHDHKNPYAKKLNEAQKLSSNFNLYRDVISIAPSIFTSMMFGLYSDYLGRKLFIVLPITGIVFQMVLTWAVCVWELNLYYIFIGFVVESCTGGGSVLFFMIFTYTTDNTEERKSKSLPMIIVGSVSHCISSLSHLAVGYAIIAYGFMWPMAAGALLGIIALVLFVVFLRETLPKRKVPCITPKRAAKEIFGFYFAKSDNPLYKRKDFIILCTVFILFATAHSVHVRKLYLLNEPFCWNAQDLGKIDTITGLIHGFYAVGIVKLMKKHLSDEAMSVYFIICSIISNVVFAVAKTDWHIYIALGAALLEGSVWTMIRAALSRMVPPRRRGALFASTAVLDVAVMRVANAAMSSLYANTVGVYKGTIFLVAAFFMVLAVMVLSIYIYRKHKEDKEKRKEFAVSCDNSSSTRQTEEGNVTCIELKQLPERENQSVRL